MKQLHPGLPTLPSRIAVLPVDERGYPVPYFVAWPEGKPEFRCVDPEKLRLCVTQKRCWVCGDTLGQHLVFVIGPMCAVNRVSAEPPSHRECAEFSVRACPFLSRPQMVRRENDLPEDVQSAPGLMIRRNPGVIILWGTRKYELSRAPDGVLFRVGAPEWVRWWKEGRSATRAEVEASMESGLPLLLAEAEREGPAAVAELVRMTKAAKLLLPKV